jgi:hypothetical protein
MMNMELGCGSPITFSHVVTIPMNITHGHISLLTKQLLGSEEKVFKQLKKDFPAIG